MPARRASRRSQRGIALLALLAVAVMVFAYLLTSRLNAASRFIAVDQQQNAAVLNQAKQALIGYMAQQAALSGENNPGHLPCPEAPSNFGTANEGVEATYCSAQAIGRLPWRTLGLPKLVDASGEPLWYAISPGWHRPNSSTTLTINSDSVGQLSVNGVANAAVAVIIAPGPAITAQAGSGCTAWVQSRATAGAPDLRNYLECENAAFPADSAFVTSRAGQTFNDQVLPVTVGDVMPALEAAIAERIQREIVPALRNVYTSAGFAGIPASSPLYPYAVPFSNPGTSNYQGVSGTYQGLFPVNTASSMVAYAATPGNAVETQGYGYIVSQTCSWVSVNDERVCQGVYHEDTAEPWRPIVLRMTATFTNVAMGLRAIDSSGFWVYARDNTGSPSWSPVTINAPSATMNADGSVTVRVSATMPNIDAMGWDTQAEFELHLRRAIIGDHALVNSSDANYGWLTRNQWQRLLYYAVAQQNTAGSLASFGCNTTNCLRFNEGLGCGGGASWCNIRALLILAGASLTGATRPNGNLADYVEYTNGDGGTFYEQHGIRRPTNVAVSNGPWNDRVILVDWLPPSLLLTSPNNHPQVVADTSTNPVRVYTLPLP